MLLVVHLLSFKSSNDCTTGTGSNADHSLIDLQGHGCALCKNLDFYDSKERQMLFSAKLKGRANSVSVSHTVIPVSSAGPSSACVPVQFQPHALIRAPQLSEVELNERGCRSTHNGSTSPSSPSAVLAPLPQNCKPTYIHF